MRWPFDAGRVVLNADLRRRRLEITFPTCHPNNSRNNRGMNMPLVRILVLVLLALLIGCKSSKNNEPVTLRSDDLGMVDLHFLAGHWSTPESADGERVEEHWTPANAGTMLGISRTMRGGRTVFFEYIRIERTPEGIFYVASPSGQGTARFELTEYTDGRLVFANPEHDFPQRIMYRRTADGLRADVEGTDRGEPRRESWQYRRARVEGE